MGLKDPSLGSEVLSLFVASALDETVGNRKNNLQNDSFLKEFSIKGGFIRFRVCHQFSASLKSIFK